MAASLTFNVGRCNRKSARTCYWVAVSPKCSMRRCNRNNKNMERHSARRCDRVGASLTITM